MMNLRLSNYSLFQNILDKTNKSNCIYSTHSSYEEYHDEKVRTGSFFYSQKFRRYMLPIMGILYIIILNLLNFKGILSNDVQRSYIISRNLSEKEYIKEEIFRMYEQQGLHIVSMNYEEHLQKLLKKKLNSGKNDVFNKYSHIFVDLMKSDIWKQYELSPFLFNEKGIYLNKYDPEINKNIIILNRKRRTWNEIQYVYSLVLKNEKLKFNFLNEYFSELYYDLRDRHKTPLYYAKETFEELKEIVSIGNKYVDNMYSNAFKKWLKNNNRLNAEELNILLMACRLLWRKTLTKIKEDGIKFLEEPFKALDKERLKFKAKGGNPLFFKANEFYEKNPDLVTYKNADYINSLKEVNIEFDEDLYDDEEEERKQKERDQELLKNTQKKICKVEGANDDSEDNDDAEDYDDYEDYEEDVYPRHPGLYNPYYDYGNQFLLTPELLEDIEKSVEQKVEKEVERRAVESFENRRLKQFVDEIRDKRLRKGTI